MLPSQQQEQEQQHPPHPQQQHPEQPYPPYRLYRPPRRWVESPKQYLRPRPDLNHIHLVLSQYWTPISNMIEEFYLNIPTVILRTLVSEADILPYLNFLGWIVLGCVGSVSWPVHRSNLPGRFVEEPIPLVGGQTFFFLSPLFTVPGYPRTDRADFVSFSDPEIVKQRSEYGHSESGADEFRKVVAERDGGMCVFTSASASEATHIIPDRCGNKWMEDIIENRKGHEDEQDVQVVESLSKVNHLNNGFLANGILRGAFERRELAIMVFPNRCVEEVTDLVVPRARQLPHDIAYPASRNYILHWLRPNGHENVLTNNLMAAFKAGMAEKDLPSALLLNVHYGIAVIEAWGRGFDALPFVMQPRRPQRIEDKRQEENGLPYVCPPTTDDLTFDPTTGDLIPPGTPEDLPITDPTPEELATGDPTTLLGPCGWSGGYYGSSSPYGIQHVHQREGEEGDRGLGLELSSEHMESGRAETECEAKRGDGAERVITRSFEKAEHGNHGSLEDQRSPDERAMDDDDPGAVTDDPCWDKENNRWNVENLMFRFWANAPAAVERRRVKHEKWVDKMSGWADGVRAANDPNVDEHSS